MRFDMRQTLKTIVLASLVLVQATSAWACPMCKYALESDDVEPRAYMISILFMMGTITVLFGLVAGLLVWVSRLEKKNLKSAGYEHVLENAVNQTRYPTPTP